MRAAAPLAFALRSSEADHGRKLGPVDGIEPSIAGMDRHQADLCLGCLCEDHLGRLLLIHATSLAGFLEKVVTLGPPPSRRGCAPSRNEFRTSNPSIAPVASNLWVSRPVRRAFSSRPAPPVEEPCDRGLELRIARRRRRLWPIRHDVDPAALGSPAEGGPSTSKARRRSRRPIP